MREQTDMGKIEIGTVADLRRVLAQPGIVVYVERHDRMDGILRRDPERMAQMCAMRTVEAVRSKDIVFATPNGKSHLDVPKASEFEADGGNRFRIVVTGRNGERQVLEYRVEIAGTPGADSPSQLAKAHPPLDAAATQAETDARQSAEDEARRRTAVHAAAFASMREMALPPRTAECEALERRMRAAIADALSQGKRYEDEVRDHMVAAVAAHDHATPTEQATVRVVRAEATLAPYVTCGIEARRLAHEPRGTWMVFEEVMENGHVSRTGLISTGADEPAFSHHPYAGGGYAEIKARLDGSTAYEIRNRMSREAEAKANADAMARHALAVGLELGTIEVNGQRYASAKVAAIEADGQIRLAMRKPRSNRGWSLTATPTAIGALIDRHRGASPRLL